MSKLTEYLIGVLLLCTGVLAFLYVHEKHTAVAAKGKVATAEIAAQDAQQVLQKAQVSWRFDLETVKQNQDAKQDITVKTEAVKEKVDEVAKQVEAKQITDAAADAQLLASMRQVYCQGALDSIDSSRCTDGVNPTGSSAQKHK